MKHLLTTLVLLTLLTLPTATYAAPPPWKATQAEVIKAIGCKYKDYGHYIVFEHRRMAGFTISDGYAFTNKGEYARRYLVLENRHFNPQQYLDDYAAVQSLLEAKYGEGTSQVIRQPGSVFNNDPAWAVMSGELTLCTIWRKGDTQVKLKLDSDEMVPSVAVRYDYLPLSKQLDKEITARRMEGF